MVIAVIKFFSFWVYSLVAMYLLFKITYCSFVMVIIVNNSLMNNFLTLKQIEYIVCIPLFAILIFYGKYLVVLWNEIPFFLVSYISRKKKEKVHEKTKVTIRNNASSIIHGALLISIDGQHWPYLRAVASKNSVLFLSKGWHSVSMTLHGKKSSASCVFYCENDDLTLQYDPPSKYIPWTAISLKDGGKITLF